MKESNSFYTKNKNIKTFSEHLDKRYGKKGSKSRSLFENNVKSDIKNLFGLKKLKWLYNIFNYGNWC